MIKREVARGLFVRPVGQAADGGFSKQQFLMALDAEYPCSAGWEIIGNQRGPDVASTIGIVIILAKYEYVAE